MRNGQRVARPEVERATPSARARPREGRTRRALARGGPSRPAGRLEQAQELVEAAIHGVGEDVHADIDQRHGGQQAVDRDHPAAKAQVHRHAGRRQDRQDGVDGPVQEDVDGVPAQLGGGRHGQHAHTGESDALQQPRSLHVERIGGGAEEQRRGWRRSARSRPRPAAGRPKGAADDRIGRVPADAQARGQAHDTGDCGRPVQNDGADVRARLGPHAGREPRVFASLTRWASAISRG